MSIGIASYQSQFNLNSAIFKYHNLNMTDWYKFLSERRKKASYKRSGFELNQYITNLINNKEITIEDVDDFLYKKLFYGQNRRVFILNIDGSYLDVVTVKRILEDEFNINLDSDTLNRISLTNVYDDDIDKLSLIDIEREKDGIHVKKVKLIITRKVYIMRSIIDDLGNQEKVKVVTNTYFPIEIDFENNIIIGKTSTSDYVDENSDLIIKEYITRLTKLLGIVILSKSDTYKKALCKMSNQLLDTIIKEKSKSFLECVNSDIDKFVFSMEKKMEEQNINIKELKHSPVYKDKSTFNMKYMISSYIENVVLSDQLLKTSYNKDGLEGVVSYIKFSDRKQINVTITTRKRTQSLIDSETYLSLRASLRDSSMIERLRVVLYNGKEEIALYYDASNMNFLEMHFYSTLYEEEFRYGLNKIRKLSNEREI